MYVCINVFGFVENNPGMVSDASKKKAAQKKAAAAAKRGGKSAAVAGAKMGSSTSTDNLSAGVENLLISDRTCTGVLCSHPLSRDIRVIIPFFYYYLHIYLCVCVCVCLYVCLSKRGCLVDDLLVASCR